MAKKINFEDILQLKDETENFVCIIDEDIILIDNFVQFSQKTSSFQLDMEAFVVCKTGRVQVNINGKDYLLEKDNMMLCSNWHFLTNAMFSSDFTSTVLLFDTKRMERVFSTFGANMNDFMYLNENPVIRLTPEEIPVLRSYHAFLKSKLKAPHEHKFFKQSISAILTSAICDLLAVVERLKSQTTLDNGSIGSHSFSNPIVQNFMVLLAKDASKNRTVQYYADKLCITPKYLSSLCHKETGKVPSRWIRDFLVEKIRYLLVSTNMSCKEIAVQLEFPNSSFFGKFAKQYLGCSPLEYRKKQSLKK